MSFKVTITNTGETIACPSDLPILHAAIHAGVDYPYACASGNCAMCMSDLKAGDVSMLSPSDGALSAEQKAGGKILACRARPRSDVRVEWLGRGRK